MKYYAGLDVSMKETAICVVDKRRKVVKEGKVGSEPETIATWLVATQGVEMSQKPVTQRAAAGKAEGDPPGDSEAASAEEKIRIVLSGLRGEDSIAQLCRREDCPKTVPQLVEGVPGGRQAAPGG